MAVPQIRSAKGQDDALLLGQLQTAGNAAVVGLHAHESGHQCLLGAVALSGGKKRAV